MVRSPHLLVCLSPHGFGHTAQTAPVVNQLRRVIPNLRVSLRTTVTTRLLQARFDPPWELIPEATDFGMIMASAVDVLAEDSAKVYAEFHRDWDNKVSMEARRLDQLHADLVLSNVPYLPLAGAARAGIPAVALCSLNWADIYAHYCGHRPEAAGVLAEMRAAYRSAAMFLQTEPSMPMSDLPQRRMVGPIARIGQDRRSEIRRRLSLHAEDILVLVSPGGMPLPVPVERWPIAPHIHYLFDQALTPRAQFHRLDQLGMHFTDVLRSSDVLVTKPGYGSFTEAVCNGTALLYLPRGDWPEEIYLTDWAAQHGRSQSITRAQLYRGELHDALGTLVQAARTTPPVPTGIEQAAHHLQQFLIPRSSG